MPESIVRRAAQMLARIRVVDVPSEPMPASTNGGGLWTVRGLRRYHRPACPALSWARIVIWIRSQVRETAVTDCPVRPPGGSSGSARLISSSAVGAEMIRDRVHSGASRVGLGVGGSVPEEASLKRIHAILFIV